MTPLLQPEDVIEFKRARFGDIRFNDIILMYADSVFITHRVIYKGEDYVITRGDNNKKADEKVGKSSIIARAVRYKRKGFWHNMEDIYTTQSLIYSGEILRISTLLQRHKIKHVFIKGLVTSLKYVKRFPQRIYGDIDLLIDREDYERLDGLMEGGGYRPLKDTWLSFGKGKKPLFEKDYFRVVQTLPVVFDIHLEPVFLMIKMKGMDLLYRDEMRRELGNHFLRNKTNLHFLGGTVPVCSVSDQIIYLSLHLFHNNFTDIVRLRLIEEIVSLHATPRVWEYIRKTAEAYKLEGYIYPVFSLLEKYFGTSVPRKIDARHALSGYKRFIARYLIRTVNVFDNDTRIMGGIKRLAFSIVFSPEPLRRKLLILIHPETFLSAVWVTGKKLVVTFAQRKIERN